MRVRVTVQGSNKVWWALAHAAATSGAAPPELVGLLLGKEGEITVEMERWRELWAWAETIEGWREGEGMEQLGSEFEGAP